MQNKKLKLIAILALFVFLFSSLCYATDDTASKELTTTSIEDIDDEDVDYEDFDDEYFDDEDFDDEYFDDEDYADEDMVEKDYFYIGGDDLVLEDTIDSNAFIIANNVTITSEIGGDLFVMANSVKLDGGYVYGNVFVLAKDFTLNATVYDIYAACSNITVEYDGVIYRDLRATADNISISGGIGRNCYVSAKSLDIASDAMIYGNLDYSSSEPIVVPEGAVQGEINYNESKATPVSSGKSFGNYVLSLLTILVFTASIYGLMIWLAPKFYSKISEIKVSKIFVGLGIGIVALICIPFASILLLITRVGSTLALALLVIYFLMLIISSAIAYITIGSLIANKLGNTTKLKTLLFVLATTLVFFLINLIPVVGTLIVFLVATSGFGILILTVVSKNKKAIAE